MYEKYLALLRERGVNTRQVCEATGIPESTMAMWKRRYEEWGGNPDKKEPVPSLETILKLTKFFGVPIEHFVAE